MYVGLLAVLKTSILAGSVLAAMNRGLRDGEVGRKVQYMNKSAWIHDRTGQ